MNTFALYARTATGKESTTSPGLFHEEDFPTYGAALRFAQTHYGHGTFLIDAGPDYVPTREEQLGLGRTKTKKEILDEI